MCSFCSSWTIQKVSAFAATAVYILSSIPSNGCGGVAGSLIVARGVAKVSTALSSTHPLTIGADGVVRFAYWMPLHHSTLSSGHSYGWYRFTKSKRSNQLLIISRQLGARACNLNVSFLSLNKHGTACMSVHIICWVETNFLLESLVQRMSIKWDKPLGQTTGWLRTRISSHKSLLSWFSHQVEKRS